MQIAKRLEPFSIGLRQRVPVLKAGARLFRIRVIGAKPQSVREVGPPPKGAAPIGRLNEAGESVMYLADSPDTAFAEVRATTGVYCLSEWRIQQPKVALANGGIPLDLLRKHFPAEFDPRSVSLGGVEDPGVLDLFRTLFTLPVETNASAYRWSIACGLVNGFAAICGRTATDSVGGNTRFTGRYPFSGIAYASMRKDRQAINFAFNDLGLTYLRLDHVQWVKRDSDGHFAGLDFASNWTADGTIDWQGRPAHYKLQPGAAAKMVKNGPTSWTYEQLDGELPEFG